MTIFGQYIKYSEIAMAPRLLCAPGSILNFEPRLRPYGRRRQGQITQVGSGQGPLTSCKIWWTCSQGLGLSACFNLCLVFGPKTASEPLMKE